MMLVFGAAYLKLSEEIECGWLVGKVRCECVPELVMHDNGEDWSARSVSGSR